MFCIKHEETTLIEIKMDSFNNLITFAKYPFAFSFHMRFLVLLSNRSMEFLWLYLYRIDTSNINRILWEMKLNIECAKNIVFKYLRQINKHRIPCNKHYSVNSKLKKKTKSLKKSLISKRPKPSFLGLKNSKLVCDTKLIIYDLVVQVLSVN